MKKKIVSRDEFIYWLSFNHITFEKYFKRKIGIYVKCWKEEQKVINSKRMFSDWKEIFIDSIKFQIKKNNGK